MIEFVGLTLASPWTSFGNDFFRICGFQLANLSIQILTLLFPESNGQIHSFLALFFLM